MNNNFEINNLHFLTSEKHSPHKLSQLCLPPEKALWTATEHNLYMFGPWFTYI